MPTADATKLDAVNDVLAMAGQVPTNSLTSTTPEVQVVIRLIDKVERDLQAEGWHWNAEFNQTFTPNGSDEIDLSDDIFEVHESSGEDEPATLYNPGAVDYAKRGGKLYNALDDTFTFTAAVKLNVLRRKAFEDIPQYARDFIVASATEKFYRVIRGEVPQDIQAERVRARGRMESAELRAVDANIMRNPSMNWVLRGR